MHDFAMTERHAIFFDTPAVMVQGWGCGGLPFRWQEGRGTQSASCRSAGRGGLVRRGRVPGYPHGQRLRAGRSHRRRWDPHRPLPVGDHGRPADPYRWEIDLTGGVVTEGPIDHRPVELPRVDERRVGRPYRHAYVVEYRDVGPANLPGSAVSPLRRRDRQVDHEGLRGRYVPGEPVFVPKSADAAEDDGWFLAFRYDRERDRSDLVVLDANEFGGDPVAVVPLPRRVPCGFHGSWVVD